MRIAFMGTPALAATVLEQLAAKHQIVAVFTRPDAVRGRGNKLVASPVKSLAQSLGLAVYTPKSLKEDDVISVLQDAQPDVICVSAYGVILPKQILEIPAYGCLNVHTSLLPRWRGAAPIERSILQGDSTTGVCIMRMEEGLDTGPYCKRVEVPIGDLSADDLADTLAHKGAQALLEALVDIEAGKVSWTEQSDEGITYAEKISKAELYLNPDDSALTTRLKIQASSSAHPARACIAGKPLAIEKATSQLDEALADACADMTKGQVRFVQKSLILCASDGPIKVVQVKPDGKKSMDARSFAGGIQGIKTKEITWGVV